ncbi:MAG: hypothetical protein AB7C98_06975 [Acidithiobacillus sp.]
MNMQSMNMHTMVASMHSISDAQTAAGMVITGVAAAAFFVLAAKLFLHIAHKEAAEEARKMSDY